ncbi:hypothetical protein E2C01_010480 [Portunus trituberculatus]|uniref:Uncharacterized protein n=1 Tax=Portunus trituberculatus TaxID=210409 RepID=A0A5B7D8R7_PORTR|nr:hypothetical protein [Portunus trituberculatus]
MVRQQSVGEYGLTVAVPYLNDPLNSLHPASHNTLIPYSAALQNTQSVHTAFRHLLWTAIPVSVAQYKEEV